MTSTKTVSALQTPLFAHLIWAGAALIVSSHNTVHAADTSRSYWSTKQHVDSKEIEALEGFDGESAYDCERETRNQLSYLLTQSALVAAFVNEFEARHQANFSAGYLMGATHEPQFNLRWAGDPLMGFPVPYNGPNIIAIPSRSTRQSNPTLPISYNELKDEVRRIRIALRMYRHAWRLVASANGKTRQISVNHADTAYRALAELVSESAIAQLNVELQKELTSTSSKSL